MVHRLLSLLPIAITIPIAGCGLSDSDLGGSSTPAETAPGWCFEDVTASSGIDFRCTFGDEEFSYILEDTGSGVATFDYDGDGLLDLYFVNGTWLEGINDPAGRPNAEARNGLYRNLGGFRFEDVTEKAGVGDPAYGMGAAVGDYDDDGDPDLYVLNYGPNVFYRNEGDGTFTDVTAELGMAGPAELNGFLKWSVNGLFFDYDEDGDLDLYVANYLAFDPAFVDPDMPEEFPYPGPESYPGQASQLYRNDGGSFTEVTQAAGLAREGGKTMGASIADFDGDGHMDLFEAVDDMQNYLFRNRGDGTFEELAEIAGAAYDRDGNTSASMHGSIGDFDGDGDFDIFVPDLGFGSLYRNQGELSFQEVHESMGLTKVQASGWGSQFEDFDNDGDLDLLIAFGGAFSVEAAELDRLFLNDGTGKYEDASAALGGYFQSRNVGRGMAVGDLDNDGDVDFAINRKDIAGTPNLVRNDLPAGSHWLILKLVGTRSNRDAIGARVELFAGGRAQVREVTRSGSYLSQNDARLHFGLGDGTEVAALRIRWPSGRVQWLEVEAIDRILEITEPE